MFLNKELRREVKRKEKKRKERNFPVAKKLNIQGIPFVNNHVEISFVEKVKQLFNFM